MRHALIALALALTACDGSGIRLVVLLRSDLTPGVEVTEAEVTVDDSVRRIPLSAGDELLDGFRLGEFTGLDPSPSRRVQVRLLRPNGTLALARTVVVDHRRDQGVVVPMSRGCRDITCPDEQTCHGGQCIDPRCDPVDPTCGASQCTVDESCPTRAACATARCLDRVCYYEDRGGCGGGRYCDLDEGCRDTVTLADAGADAGSDAGVDGGPPPISRAVYLVGDASSWHEESFSGEGPTDRVLAAFTSGDEVVVLTAAQVFFLDWGERTWITLAGRSTIFPQLEDQSINEATLWPDPGVDPRLRIFGVGGGWWDYRWTGWRRAGVFIERVSPDALPAAWSTPEAPQRFAVELAMTDPSNASGWVVGTPSCMMVSPVGQHVLFISTNGFGPGSWPRSVFEPRCQDFLPSSATTSYPPFLLPDTPSLRSIHAGTFVGGSILLFVGT